MFSFYKIGDIVMTKKRRKKRVHMKQGSVKAQSQFEYYSHIAYYIGFTQ